MTTAHSAPRIDGMLRSAVQRRLVPQVVAMAADDTDVVYEGAAGPMAAGAGSAPVGPDSIFRIASMTKIVCSVAALQLRDRGDLQLDAPVESIVPEFSAVRVLAGWPDGRPILRRPASRATVRQLLTHTSGLGYSFWNVELHRWSKLAADQGRPPGPFATPMVADPGTRFEYGLSTDWLGRVIEIVSGQTLDAYLDRNILTPLGMRSTAFRLDAEQRGRCVPVHRRDAAGDWIPTGADWDPDPPCWSAGHGLYSSPRDYLRFQRMLVGAGSLHGTTVLDAGSVREMFTDQLGGLGVPPVIRTAEPATSCDFRPGPGCTWGFGLLLNTVGRTGERAPGSGGWAGIFNTYVWIDPASRLTGALYSQFAPFLDPGATRTFESFEQSVYTEQSIPTRRRP